MAVIHMPATDHHNLSKRVVTSDDGDLSIPRVFAIVFIILALILISYFGARNVYRRRGRRLYNTRRNQGPVRVQRLEAYGGSSPGSGGERLPAWSERSNHQRVSQVVAGEGLDPLPPVYKRQDSVTVQRDPPPPYMGRGAPNRADQHLVP